MKKTKRTLLILITFLSVISCKKEPTNNLPEIKNSYIYVVSPKHGSPTEVVNIVGGFKDKEVKIYFPGKSGNPVLAEIVKFSEDQLTVNVPEGVIEGKIQLVDKTGTYFSIEPFKMRPKVNSILPAVQYIGGEITITGEFFGKENQVLFKKSVFDNEDDDTKRVKGEVLSSSETEIRVRIPKNAITGTVKVISSGIMMSDKQFDTPAKISVAIKPVIVSVSPQTAEYNSTITIKGNGFREDFSENIVKFQSSEGGFVNGIVSSSSSKTELKVVVPKEAVTGKLRVVVKDSSNQDIVVESKATLTIN